MPKLYNNDYEMPRPDYPVPRENDAPKEEFIPREEAYSFDEFNLAPRKERPEEDSRSSLKQRFLKPVAAIIAVTAVVFAALGRDPFANDPLNKDGTVLAADTAPTGGEAGTEVPTEDTEVPTDDTEKPENDTTVPDETTSVPDDEDEDVFPTLDNLDPDFAGNFAWSGEGSEEYIRFSRDGDATASYLQKGGAWNTYDPGGNVVTDPTAVYDKGSNTLTLSGFDAAMLDVNLMGNGFTINLEGDNHIGAISVWGAMYGGSVKFTGDGTLTVDHGIVLNCEGSGSCIMVAKGVTLDISGESGAINIYDSTLTEPAIYLSKSLKLEGGKVGAVGDVFEAPDGTKAYTYSVIDANGNPVPHVKISPES